MTKEKGMLEAHILKKDGFKQKTIAEKIGVTDRTVRNYLSKKPCQRKKRNYSSKLNSFKSFISSVINVDPDYNCVLLYDRLKKMSYTGRISILRDYVSGLKKKIFTEAVIRFETEPGLQAQVDWASFGMITVNGKSCKLYAFAMCLGYSRKPFLFFTTSMKEPILLGCHVRVFEYFKGVPKEVLYDNMKTAFVCDSEGHFQPNKKLLGFAHHYGFMPKRCMIYRPQTKGKVERFIQYVKNNFWPRVAGKNLTVDELNEEVMKWLDEIGNNVLRDFQQSRNDRFEIERGHLQPLPEYKYDIRDVHEVHVHRDSQIRFETNKYSIPPEFIGKMLTLKRDPFGFEAELLDGSNHVRTFTLFPAGSRKSIFYPEDKEAVQKIWEKQFWNKVRRLKRKKQLLKADNENDVRPPSHYDNLFPEVAS